MFKVKLKPHYITAAFQQGLLTLKLFKQNKTPSKPVTNRLPFVSDEMDNFQTIGKFRDRAPVCVTVYICVGGYYIPDLVCSVLAFGSDPHLLIPRPGKKGLWCMWWWWWHPFLPPFTTVPWHPSPEKRNPRLCFLSGEVSKGAWPGWTCRHYRVGLAAGSF